MRRIWLLLALLILTACKADPPEEPAITGACERSFRPTLKAWEAELGRVPEGCEYLDTEYVVQLVSEAEMPCDEPVGDNEVRAECVHGQVLYINEALDDIQQTEASVHGWTHVITECADGDGDHDHLRGELWSRYGQNTVEFRALTRAEIGECL